MVKGAHGRGGPPPDPLALRRDRGDDRGWTHLPAAGRQGPPPPWPLVKPTRRELELWRDAWSRPQAVVWEQNGQAVEVALYVRTLREAEAPAAGVMRRVLVARMADALGLSMPGLLRNRWVIASTDGAPARPTVIAGGAARDRLRGGSS